jgi:hypothetical protein
VSDVPSDPRDFSPHPLVVALAEGLGTIPNARRDLRIQAERLGAARSQAIQAAAAPPAPPQVDSSALRAGADALARELLVDELVTFEGYVGGSANLSVGGTGHWLVLYRTVNLQEWLIVPQDEIVARTKVDDPTAPYGSYDLIWVKQQAAIRHGSGPQSVATAFLSGDFTRASDVEPSPTGGTFSSPSGLLCAPGGPGGCRRTSVR